MRVQVMSSESSCADTEFMTITHLCNILRFFTAVKNGYFQMTKCDNLLTLAQNIDRGYSF